MALLILSACAGPTVEDCHEAERIYDEAPGVWAGVLTATVCAG